MQTRLFLTLLCASLLVLYVTSIPTPPPDKDFNLFEKFGHVLLSDTEIWLAQRFPFVPAHERANIGNIPDNLFVSARLLYLYRISP